MLLGIDRLLSQPNLTKSLAGRRVALLAHPASVTRHLEHSLDALMRTDLDITAAFGPQHGMRGEKQDNMVESKDYVDPVHGIPVFSLYGKVRRPTTAMLDTFEVMLFDVQDLGCRIYTYITTLLYMMEACAEHGKSLWVLDRPNPAGRPIEGMLCQDEWQSFVGAGRIIMRHGLTIGEMARWFMKYHRLDLDLTVIRMEDYEPFRGPGYGWPFGKLPWVNPSPNASSLNMARCYAGTVLLEGTTLSEGRGTTIPLEVAGAPDIDIAKILQAMWELAPQWLRGVRIRPCYFEPMFHKHAEKLCQGFQLHTDSPDYDHLQFKPYRLIILFLKALRQCHPDYPLWREFTYEYETERLAFDLINGGDRVRQWIDDPHADIESLEAQFEADENQWRDMIDDIVIY